MSVLAAMLTLMLLAAVMAVVARPLLVARTQAGTGKPEESDTAKRSELEAEREAKYREIRDAELDYRTGKLSQEDYEAVNGALRAEAVEILNKLESSEGESENSEENSERDRKVEGDQAVEEDRAPDPAK
jgi:hypothetical protein